MPNTGLSCEARVQTCVARGSTAPIRCSPGSLLRGAGRWRPPCTSLLRPRMHPLLDAVQSQGSHPLHATSGWRAQLRRLGPEACKGRDAPTGESSGPSLAPALSPTAARPLAYAPASARQSATRSTISSLPRSSVEHRIELRNPRSILPGAGFDSSNLLLGSPSLMDSRSLVGAFHSIAAPRNAPSRRIGSRAKVANLSLRRRLARPRPSIPARGVQRT